MKKTEEKVIRFIKSASLIEEGDKVIVALSGGPDSVFLLNIFKKYQKKYKITIGAFHLNHKLRGKAADSDEKFCSQLCKKLQVEYFSASKNIKTIAKKNRISIEEAGRNIRYKLLNDICLKRNYSKIATAHIQDDNTETVFLNLIKGTGLSGMSGIPVRRGNIIRPILCLSKTEILDYLHLNKLDYRIDETNLSEDYERNYLRKQIIPTIKSRLNPSLDETVFNSALVFQSVKDFIENSINVFLDEVVSIDKSGITINISRIAEHHKLILSESLRKVILNEWGLVLNYNDVTKIIGLINKQSGLSVELTGNLVASRNSESLIIRRKLTPTVLKSFYIRAGEIKKTELGVISVRALDKGKVSYNPDANLEYISADNISGKLKVRVWKPGDKFVPLGMKGEKKISDFLIDEKISRFTKQDQLVLVDNKKIIWLIGKRIDNRFRITTATKKVLELCWKPVRTL